ncbi:Uncharacterised protein [[Clostridium] sordellii]|uniref:hypothetical protein n=1 Tax=Paraclostridium sordellii TaxID=1505 RepID=UPI0005E5664F|nr:hypothetical protein [Paeniclostridium sordellii]CEQ00410.1 Uncharacterised protein [[Clostridium] sordellii] [Paeniclostridium sordellii]
MRIKKIISKLKEQLFIADLLLMIALLIMFGTTYSLNAYVGMYLLSIILICLSYLIQKK